MGRGMGAFGFAGDFEVSLMSLPAFEHSLELRGEISLLLLRARPGALVGMNDLPPHVHSEPAK